MRSRAALVIGMLIVTAIGAACTPRGPLVRPNPVAAGTPTPAGAASPSSAVYRCSRVEISSSSPSVEQGGILTFTANAFGCAPADYQFLEVNLTTGDWMITQEWSASATWSWNTARFPVGPYSVVADARARDEPGRDPDASIGTGVEIVLATGATPPAGLTCRLPISWITPGSGGFVQLPEGTYTPDPSSQVPAKGQQDLAGLRLGLTYDPVHKTWLPAPRDWVMPDFSAYIYLGSEPGGQPSIHRVDVASGKDTVWPNGNQLYGRPIALRPEGVYGAPGPQIITLVSPTGVVTTVDQGHYGLFAVITSNAIFATRWGSDASGRYTLTTVQRIDRQTGVARDWFSSGGQTVLPVGVDESGNPIIAVGTQLSDGRASAAQLWVVPPQVAAAGTQPSGELLYDNAGSPITIRGSAIASGGNVWVESDMGLWVGRPGDFTMALVSSRIGYVTGGCI